MAAAFDGVRRTLTGSVDRAELTGRPSFGEEQINGKAIEILAETGGDLDRLLELAERASKGDLAAGEDLASIRATQILLDDANQKLRLLPLNTVALVALTPKHQLLASSLLQPMMRCALALPMRA